MVTMGIFDDLGIPKRYQWEPMTWLVVTGGSLGGYWVKKVDPEVQNGFKTWKAPLSQYLTGGISLLVKMHSLRFREPPMVIIYIK